MLHYTTKIQKFPLQGGLSPLSPCIKLLRGMLGLWKTCKISLFLSYRFGKKIWFERGGSKIRVSQLINTPALTNTFDTSDSKALMTKLHFFKYCWQKKIVFIQRKALSTPQWFKASKQYISSKIWGCKHFGVALYKWNNSVLTSGGNCSLYLEAISIATTATSCKVELLIDARWFCRNLEKTNCSIFILKNCS